MSETSITEMSSEEFEAIIEAYIERESHNMGEIEAALFYEALEEIFAIEPQSVELSRQSDNSLEHTDRLPAKE